MIVKVVSVADLLLNPRNARKHSRSQLEAIGRSLKKFGQQKPIVAKEDGEVIAGNGTLQAARELGWKKIAVVYSELTGDDATGYGIADNALSDKSEFDPDILAEQLGSLNESGFDLNDCGFNEFDVRSLLADFDSPEKKPKTLTCPHCGSLIELDKK